VTLVSIVADPGTATKNRVWSARAPALVPSRE